MLKFLGGVFGDSNEKEVRKLAPLISEAISRIYSDRSVGALFHSETPDGADELLDFVSEASRR